MAMTYRFSGILLSFILSLQTVTPILLPNNFNEDKKAPSSFSVRESIMRGLKTTIAYEERLKSFFEFMLFDSPSDHLIVFYDERNVEEVAPLLQSAWSDFFSDLTIMPYEGSLRSAEPILKSYNHAGKIRNVLVLCEPSATLSLFKEIQVLSLESPTLRWLVIGDHPLIDPLTTLIREGTQVTISAGDITEKIQVFTSFIDINNSPRFRKLKSWQMTDQGKIIAKREGPPRKDPAEEYNDFGNRNLLIATLRNIPFLDLVADGEFVTPIGGIEYHMLNIIKDRLNFSFKMKLPPDGQWGEVFPNGSATGIVGMVARRDTDFCLGELTIMGAREKVVDFSQPYFTESTTLVTRAPKKKSQALALVMPFTLEAWIALICSTLAMGPLLLMFSYILDEYAHLGVWERLSVFQYGMFRAMAYNDSYLTFKTGPIRIASGTWYIFCSFVFIVYSNMLIAALIVPKYEKPIDSLEDMLVATSEGAIMLVNPGSSFEFIFKRADEGIYKDIWNNFNPSLGYVPDSKTGVSEVLKAWNVFVTAQMKSQVLTTIMGKKKFNIARNSFYPQSYGMAFRSGAPYQTQFNDIILKFTETGLIDKWTSDELNVLERKSAFGSKQKTAEGNLEEEDQEEGNELEPFSLSHLQAAFYLLAIGYSLSTIVLFVEFSCKRLI